MTKRQDLRLQRRSRSEPSNQRQPNQAANISHQPRASSDSTSLASRIEFPTMTGGIGGNLGGLSQQSVSPLFIPIGLPPELSDKAKYPKQSSYSGAPVIVYFVFVIHIEPRAKCQINAAIDHRFAGRRNVKMDLYS